ncbi:MAG: class I SAM-dependent methyltransferase [bacterium]
MNFKTIDGEKVSILRVLKAGISILNPNKPYVDPQSYEVAVNLGLNRGKVAQELAKSIRKLSPNAKNVLDIAAGTGMASKYLTEVGFDVTATDVSKEQVNYIREKKRAKSLIVMDFNQKFPFPNSTFDAVTTLAANRYILDLEQFATEVYRVLIPGGTFVWPIFWQDNIDFIRTHRKIITPDNFIDILNNSGFTAYKIKSASSFVDLRRIIPSLSKPTYIIGEKIR